VFFSAALNSAAGLELDLPGEGLVAQRQSKTKTAKWFALNRTASALRHDKARGDTKMFPSTTATAIAKRRRSNTNRPGGAHGPF